MGFHVGQVDVETLGGLVKVGGNCLGPASAVCEYLDILDEGREIYLVTVSVYGDRVLTAAQTDMSPSCG